ncbi:MAG: thiosulfate oxidation carrier complex protein SoxZ [Pseudomonadota bacterium]
MSRVKPRVKVPKQAKPGDVITIKTLISHPMESGHRPDRDTGEMYPRKIINRFVARFDGEEVVDFDLNPGVSANPYFKFQMVFPGAGTMAFEWIDDDGSVYQTERKIEEA